MAGFVLAVFAVIFGSGATVLPLVGASSKLPATEIGIMFTAVGLFSLAVYGVAAICSVVGLLRPHRPRLLAAAGTAIAGAGLFSTVTGLILPPLIGIALSH